MTKKKFTNTLYTDDNLFVLTGMNSNSVDLIYLDPPFNSKRIYSAPIGTKAAGSSFKDMWTWQDVNEAYLDTLADKFPSLTKFIISIGGIHSKAMMAYLTYMAQRIIEMHRVLKDTGSLYLHCDQAASHYLKILLDEIFGKNNFRNEIIWKRKSSVGQSNKKSRQFGYNIDTIYFYSKTKNNVFHTIFTDSNPKYIKQFFTHKDPDGRVYRLATLTSPAPRQNLIYEYKGHKPPEKGWAISLEKMKEWDKIGKIHIPKDVNKRIQRKIYLDEVKGLLVQTLWDDIDVLSPTSKERTGYPTQKPLALLHRIIKASSNEGDIVLDPFCGCATTCVAAQQLDRKWIGIDIEKQAVDILVERLSNDAGLFKDFVNTKIVPQRTDVKRVGKTDSVKERLYKEQNGLCKACGTKFDLWNLEIDHIIPQAKGGGNYYENYQLLCGSCNRIKGDRPMEYLRLKIKTRDETMKNKIIFGE